MRPADVYVNSATFSPWVSVDYIQSGFGIGLGFSLSAGASLTASVQHTFDDFPNGHPITATQATTVITVTDRGFTQAYGNVDALGGHGLSVGDWVKLTGTSLQPTITGMDGEYSVATVVSATQYTLTSLVSQTATAGQFAQATTARVYPHANMVGMTTRKDGNYAYPVMAVRLLLTAWASGIASLGVRQGGQR